MNDIKLPRGVTTNKDVYVQPRVKREAVNHWDYLYIGVAMAIVFSVLFSISDTQVQQAILNPIYAVGGGQ